MVIVPLITVNFFLMPPNTLHNRIYKAADDVSSEVKYAVARN
jgi:hypothetical protein